MTIRLLGEVDGVEQLLDHGGTLTSAEYRLVVQVHQQAMNSYLI